MLLYSRKSPLRVYIGRDTIMDNYWLRKSKKKKCDYRMLTDGEIKKLKHHDYDPEEMKEPDGSKADLFKCKGSGKVAIGRKSWHQDKDRRKYRQAALAAKRKEKTCDGRNQNRVPRDGIEETTG
jgi:hypothetical protein